jgi:hypothetical protein
MKWKLSTETPVCPRERLVIISYTTGLSFALERIGPLAAITITIFYKLVLYLLALPNTPENPFASIYSESLIKTACQHLLLLVGFDTLIYRKYYNTPPILVGHQCVVATREKTTILCSRTFVLFTLHTLLKAIICCLQLNTQWLLGRHPKGGLLVIDVVGLRSMYYVVMPKWIS